MSAFTDPRSRIGAGFVATVECGRGHHFRTGWIPGMSLKAIRLGRSRVQWCPVGRHFSVIQRVEVSDAEAQSLTAWGVAPLVLSSAARRLHMAVLAAAICVFIVMVALTVVGAERFSRTLLLPIHYTLGGVPDGFADPGFALSINAIVAATILAATLYAAARAQRRFPSVSVILLLVLCLQLCFQVSAFAYGFGLQLSRTLVPVALAGAGLAAFGVAAVGVRRKALV